MNTKPLGTVWGAYRSCGLYVSEISPAAKHWYAVQWAMLTRRLRYPGSPKARRAERRLRIHWRAEDVARAIEEARRAD